MKKTAILILAVALSAGCTASNYVAPTPDTALVYPGGCLLEATWASEGRGTTRPFELFGAPEVDAGELVRALEAMRLPGVRFRTAAFRPTVSFYELRTAWAWTLPLSGMLYGAMTLDSALRHAFGAESQWR